MKVGLWGLVIGLLAWSMGCQQQARPPGMSANALSPPGPDQESWDVRYMITELGVEAESSLPRATLVAAYMARYEIPDSTYLLLKPDTASLEKQVQAFLFDEMGDSSAVVLADEIRYLEDARRFEAQGAVEVTTAKGRRLEGEQLHWLEAERMLRTDGFVRITTEKEILQGYDLVADEDLESYSLARVTGQLTLEDS